MIVDKIQVEDPRTAPRRGARSWGSGALAAVAVVLAAMTGGCSIFGADLPARTWYELADLHADAAPADNAKGNSLVLLISPTSESSFYDGTSIAFSREGGGRGYYQYASWTERPVRKLAQLLERRLAARGSFGTVAQATAGIRGDLLLNLRLEEIYLDAGQPPGTARVAVTAELLDWRERKVIGRQRFEQAAPAPAEDSAGVALGFNRAATGLIDELTAWLEASSAGSR